MEYRSLKIGGNAGLVKYCEVTNSLYQKDPVGFSNSVEQEENRLTRQAELLRLAGKRKRKPRP